MRKYLAPLVAAVVAAAVSLGLGHHSSPKTGTSSVTRLAYAQVQSMADQANVQIVWEKLLAYRQKGDETVARVYVVYKYAQFDFITGRTIVGKDHAVVVVHLRRSAWQVVDSKVVS